MRHNQQSLNTTWSFKIVSLIGILLVAILGSGMLIVLLSSLAGLTVTDEAQLFNYLSEADNQIIVKTLIAANHIVIFIIAPLCYLMIFHRNKIKAFLQLKPFQPILLLLFAILLFTLLPLMSYLAFYINQIDFPDFLDQMDQDSMNALGKILEMNTIWALIINLIVVAVLPGIGEELLFRGVLQKELSIAIRNPHIAIWVTAFIFSAFHFQVTGFVPKMMIGLVLGYAYHLSGSLWLPMALHTMNNGFATISLYLSGGDFSPEGIPEENVSPWLVIMFLGAGYICYKYIYAITQSQQNADE